MIIQDRDREILRCIFEQQFLLMDHVVLFFKTANKREAYRRISEMERAGLVYREKLFGFRTVSAIRVTRMGASVALETSNETRQVMRIDRATAEHDVYVTFVRVWMERFWDGWWLSERYLKQTLQGLIPDGIFEFNSYKRVRVEVEHSFKGQLRIRRILAKLELERGSKDVLFLFVATDKSYSTSLRHASRVRPSFPSPLFSTPNS